MKVSFAPSFFKSLRKLRKYETWWYKTYEVMRYKLPYFFGNIRRFRKELWAYRSWDWVFSLKLLRRGIELSRDTLRDHGNEVEDSRMRKVAKMTRAVELLTNFIEDNFVEQSERELGTEMNHDYLFSDQGRPAHVDESNKRILSHSYDLQNKQWAELWEILKGTGEDDGTDFRGWWD